MRDDSWYEGWLTKACEHLESGELLFSQGKLRDAITRYYYAAFSLMVAVCGKPKKGRWEHKGILKYFSLWLYERGNLLLEDELDLLYEFYEKRRVADYTLEGITEDVVRSYRILVKRMFEVLKDGRRKNSFRNPE